MWNVVYKVEDQKRVKVAVRQQSLCLLLEGGESWLKSRALGINCRISKHSSAILWVDGLARKMCLLRLPEKEKPYQSWPTYWKTNFSLSSRKENLPPQEFCSPCWTKVRNCAATFSQIREKLNTPTDNMNNYCDWKEWVNLLIPIHFFVIWLCKSLSVRIFKTSQLDLKHLRLRDFTWLIIDVRRLIWKLRFFTYWRIIIIFVQVGVECKWLTM